MSHADLTTTSASVSGYAAARSFAMVTTDPNTIVHVLSADTVGVTDITLCAFVAELTFQRKTAQVQDSSTYLLYAVKQGTAPTAIWVDAQTPVSSSPSSSSSQGTVQLSVAPTTAATPIAVGNNDVRVTTIEVPISLSGSDGTLTELPIPRPAPGVACTLVSASLNMAAAAAASDTNYITATVAKRNGSGGGATTLVAGTTQVTGGVNTGGGLLAFQEVSLGALSVAAIAAGDVLTFKSAKTSGGVASGAGKLKLTFTVP